MGVESHTNRKSRKGRSSVPAKVLHGTRSRTQLEKFAQNVAGWNEQFDKDGNHTCVEEADFTELNEHDQKILMRLDANAIEKIIQEERPRKRLYFARDLAASISAKRVLR